MNRRTLMLRRKWGHPPNWAGGRPVFRSRAVPNLRERIQSAAQFAIWIGVGLYVIGLLVTNTYLYQLGISEFSLLRAQFVYAGAVALSPIIGPLLVLNLILFILGSKNSSRLEKVSGIVLGSTLLVASAGFIWLGLEAVPLETGNGVVIYVFIFGFGVSILFSSFYVPNFSLYAKGMSSSISKILKICFAVATLILFGAYLSIYTWVLFPAIPEQFGGAEPKLVRFFFLEENIELAGAVGVLVSDNGTSEIVLLLFQRENSYTIQLGEPEGLRRGRIIQLGTAYVAATEIICGYRCDRD